MWAKAAALVLGLAAASPCAAETAAPGAFDFYVLSLSWSPGFCATGGDQKAKDQCAAGSNLGFVVHGLWPQNTHGFPSDCGPAGRSPSRQALDTVQGLYPDEGLARYEWRKHGTCSGLSPTDYFASVRRAHDAVAIPAAFQTPKAEQTWAPIDVARAFSAANPGLRTDEMAVTCRSSDLQEVRICFSKDLKGFTPCPEVARASCRAAGVTVPPVR
jgi:ribonuclease T2